MCIRDRVRKRETFEDLMANQIEVDVTIGETPLKLPELATLALEDKEAGKKSKM